MDDPPQTPPSTAAEILAEIRALYPRWREPGITDQIYALSRRHAALTAEDVPVVAAVHPAHRVRPRPILNGATVHPSRSEAGSPYFHKSRRTHG